MKLLLPIKPQYVEKILSGEKKYEFRKQLCKKKVDTIVIYATSPMQKVVGEVKVVDTLKAPKEEVWQLTAGHAGIVKNDYDEYFASCEIACAYVLGDVLKYQKVKSLQEYGITYAPQSYVYLE